MCGFSVKWSAVHSTAVHFSEFPTLIRVFRSRSRDRERYRVIVNRSRVVVASCSFVTRDFAAPTYNTECNIHGELGRSTYVTRTFAMSGYKLTINQADTAPPLHLSCPAHDSVRLDLPGIRYVTSLKPNATTPHPRQA